MPVKNKYTRREALELGLGAVAFAYVAIRRLDYGQSDNGTSQDHPSRR